DRWIASTQMMRAKLIRGRVLCGFHDWSQATGYDTESRKLFTRWVEEHGYRFQRITIYTPSRLVRMGIATAKLVLGSSIDTVPTREALEALIAQAIEADR